MQPKKQLITLGQNGELFLKSLDGSVQKLADLSINANQSLVYLVVDCSASMTGKKITQAKNGSLDFASTAFGDGYSVGLVSFSDNVSHLCSPSDSLKELTRAVNNLKIEGGTNLAPAIEQVISQFRQKTDALRAMVIITDGQTENPQSALSSAEKAKRLGISILTIGTDDADFGFLSRLASDTNLAKKVKNDYLEESISQAAKMLPRGK